MCEMGRGTYPPERADNPGVCEVVSGVLRGVIEAGLGPAFLFDFVVEIFVE